MNSYKLVESKFIYKKCDFCGSDKYKVLLKTRDYLFKSFPDIFYIVKCENCDLVYTNPVYKKSELNKFYMGRSEYNNRPPNLSKKDRFNILLRLDILTDYFNYPILKKKILRKIIQYPNFLRIKRKWKTSNFVPLYIKNGKVLEVGCSFGGYLYQLKKLGWETKGIELSKEAVDYAINKLKLDVLCIDFKDFNSKDLFDYIYLLNILEHTESPKNTLKKCYNLLKPKGKLILSFPDFNGIEVRLFKKYAYTIQAPYHLYHFTPKTIKKYLESLNFKNINVTHSKSTRDLIAPLIYYLQDYPNKILIKILLKVFKKNIIRDSIIKYICGFLSILGKTSRMIVLATR